ncbi:hypothetical protein [Rhodovulum strictum]|uniref:Uncharacterized protein n=1 Tax=Rhodovulum strictum TaxID=58314 RepID=A0A844BF01_9RHOB|nr:hypothetical protein [Rhodovulum strictum]MRH21138.1 hypothetical protein [Rhodovulum strictum]
MDPFRVFRAFGWPSGTGRTRLFGRFRPGGILSAGLALVLVVSLVLQVTARPGDRAGVALLQAAAVAAGPALAGGAGRGAEPTAPQPADAPPDLFDQPGTGQLVGVASGAVMAAAFGPAAERHGRANAARAPPGGRA